MAVPAKTTKNLIDQSSAKFFAKIREENNSKYLIRMSIVQFGHGLSPKAAISNFSTFCGNFGF